jgi:hypothetical protein
MRADGDAESAIAGTPGALAATIPATLVDLRNCLRFMGSIPQIRFAGRLEAILDGAMAELRAVLKAKADPSPR